MAVTMTLITAWLNFFASATCSRSSLVRAWAGTAVTVIQTYAIETQPDA